MELINRYIHEVGKNLPSKIREDVQVELRSLIEDRLEDSNDKGGRTKEETVVDILRQMGPPKKMANSYSLFQQQLIGGHLYPIFLTVVGIVLGVIGGGYLIALAFSLDGFSLTAVFDSLASALPGLLSGAFEAIGIIVVIFAVLERLNASGDVKPEKWDPRKLPAVDDPTRTDNRWLIIESCLLALILLLLNLFPEKAGGFFQGNGQTTFVPLLSPEFMDIHVPLLNLWLGLGVGLNLIIIWRGRWQILTRLIDFGLSILGLFVIFRLFTVGPIIGLNPDWISNETAVSALVDTQMLAFLTSILNAFLVIAFIIMLILLAGQIFQLFKFFRRDQNAPSISPQR